jgi:hypothetical protein
MNAPKPDSLVVTTSRRANYEDFVFQGAHNVYTHQGRVVVVPVDVVRSDREFHLQDASIFINGTGDVAKNRFGKATGE